MATIADKRKAILQALWRKAHETGQPVVIKLKDDAEANRIRFDLYAAVKAVKANPGLDPGLHAAVTSCSITYQDSKTLQIGTRNLEDALMEAAGEYGLDVESLRKAPETNLEAEFRTREADSIRRMEENLQPTIPVAVAETLPVFNYGAAEPTISKTESAIDEDFIAAKMKKYGNRSAQ